MIYPTARTIFLLLAGAPAALVLGLVRPEYWLFAVGWVMFVLALMLIDALAGPQPGRLQLAIEAPRQAGVGEDFTIAVTATDTRGGRFGARAAFALGVDPRLADSGRMEGPLDRAADGADGAVLYAAEITARGARRGTAALESLWVRWTGPLGLAWKQRRQSLDRDVKITPSMKSVRDEGIRLFARDAQFGMRSQLLIGEGSEFESLAEFRPGMDRRAIDWKQSARHGKLLAKEYRIERDNRLVLAIDAGRSMTEPVAGMPRIDRAVAAALLLGYVGLKMNDRVSLFHFASRPRAMTPAFTHSRNFIDLQRAAAAIDYAHEESNFTLALTTLAARLKRRSLIVLFTEFTDATSADLMIRAAGKLARSHALVFVVLRDVELEDEVRRTPDAPVDIVRSNVAAAMLRDRRIVIARLQRLGADVIEAPHDAVGSRIIEAYLRIKRKGVI